MQAGELARRLAADVEAVCKHLLPQGKRDNHEWRAGSVHGEPGKSLGVHLVGEKAGVWKDFAGDDGGDLLDLWQACRGIGLVEAMREACDWLGIPPEPRFASGRPPECKPIETPKGHPPRPDDAVMQWLKARGISDEAIAAYRLAANRDELLQPYFRGGELVAVKYRNIHDKSRMRVDRGGEMPLFGWQAIPDDARTVVLTEGELDAVACWQGGFPALSVPNGAQGLKWIEVEYELLERFDTIFVWMDADESGQKAIQKIVDRLGAHRCRVVQQPEGKDANDALLKGLDFAKLIGSARTLDPTELKSAGVYVDEVVKAFYPPDDYEPGIRAPWDKAEGKILFRPAELTIVTGINGHGKSILTSQIALHGCWQGHRACIASMEMQPKLTLARMTRQAAGLSGAGYDQNPTPSIPYIRAINKWLDDKLWLFAVTGTAKAERMLEVFQYAHKRYGIELFVVDSLSKCGLAEDDYNGQKALVERLKDFTIETDAHVLLITHPRKSSSEDDQPGKMDVRGAQSITDMADNGCSLWRNKRKELAMQKPEGKRTEAEQKLAEQPDAFLTWWKSRNGEWEGRIALWWGQASQQFLETPKHRPRTYVEFYQQAVGAA